MYKFESISPIHNIPSVQRPYIIFMSYFLFQIYIYIGALWIDEFKRKWVLLFKARRDALEVDVIWLHNESLALIKAAALRAGSP